MEVPRGQAGPTCVGQKLLASQAHWCGCVVQAGASVANLGNMLHIVASLQQRCEHGQGVVQMTLAFPMRLLLLAKARLLDAMP